MPSAAHLAQYQFRPGQSGNPAGKTGNAHRVLSHACVKAFAEDFAQHGVAAIEAVRLTAPEKYLDLIAKIIGPRLRIELTGAGEEGLPVVHINMLGRHAEDASVASQEGAGDVLDGEVDDGEG